MTSVFVIPVMPDIGLRLRFFLIIFTVLLIVAISAIVTHDKFLRQDRMALIDQQVRNTAASIMGVEQGDFTKIDFQAGEKIVATELGPNRTSRMFLVRDENDKVIYESPGAIKYNLSQASTSPQWTDLHKEGKFIRILNLETPQLPGRKLQVGYVIDDDLVNPDYFTSSSLIYLAIIFFLGFAASLFLTSWLLKPIAQIGRFLSAVSDAERTQYQPLIPSLPDSMFPKSKIISKDEFTSMVMGLNVLITKVNRNYRFSRLWAYQMAHELKTPLAILGLEIEKIQKLNGLEQKDIEPLTTESLKISETINSFLAWAELENTSQQRNLYINQVSEVVRSIVKRFERSFPRRIQLQLNTDLRVIANPQHLEQLISNLLANGLSYSDSSKPMIIQISGETLSFIDYGSGIPEEVLNRLGEPFNRIQSQYSSTKGSGLGLAWVHSICRVYSWKINIKSTQRGSEITIHFPPKEEVVAPSFSG